MANLIADLVDKYYPKACPGEIKIEWEEFEDTPLEDVLSTITIYRPDVIKENHWYSPEAGYIGPSFKELQNLISSKEKKIEKYLKKCGAAWLIIVADGLHISSTVHPENVKDIINQHRLNTRFTRVIMYDRFLKRAFTLFKNR